MNAQMMSLVNSFWAAFRGFTGTDRGVLLTLMFLTTLVGFSLLRMNQRR